MVTVLIPPTFYLSRRRLRHPDGQLPARRDRLFHAALPATPERPQLPGGARLPGARHSPVPHGQPLSPLLLRRLPRGHPPAQRPQPHGPPPETAAHRPERPATDQPHVPGVPPEPGLVAGRGGRGAGCPVLTRLPGRIRGRLW